MALNQRLDLRQGQSLVMTPQLQQAIKLLQMSNMELQAFVDQELERNPLLERDECGDVQKQVTEGGEQTDMVSALAADAGAEERLRTLDTELENVYTHESRADAANREAMAPPPESGWASLRPQGALSLDAEGLDFDATLTRKPTLAEHLTDQMHLALTALPTES